ncbi:receptor-type tyrosine-protein phosphatase C isoform X4 [Salminus brasiliensis]|uniref:receptor-type tyrosine-protein phosphatase C isoform X4 n=1 Tax=Salminus brasiliensis TaxID=930266 RepID=UPI003B82E3ED
MATFPGLRFLLLVLTGLAVCIESSAGGNSSGSSPSSTVTTGVASPTHTSASASGIPASTVSKVTSVSPPVSSSSPSVTDTDINTTPPLTTSHQHSFTPTNAVHQTASSPLIITNPPELPTTKTTGIPASTVSKVTSVSPPVSSSSPSVTDTDINTTPPLTTSHQHSFTPTNAVHQTASSPLIITNPPELPTTKTTGIPASTVSKVTSVSPPVSSSSPSVTDTDINTTPPLTTSHQHSFTPTNAVHQTASSPLIITNPPELPTTKTTGIPASTVSKVASVSPPVSSSSPSVTDTDINTTPPLTTSHQHSFTPTNAVHQTASSPLSITNPPELPTTKTTGIPASTVSKVTTVSPPVSSSSPSVTDTDINTTPPLTTSHQHSFTPTNAVHQTASSPLSITNPPELPTTKTTGIPASTVSKVTSVSPPVSSSSPSDTITSHSASTVSNMNTTLPTLISSTTDKNQSCLYSLTEFVGDKTYAFKVTINTTIQMKFSVEYIDTLENTTAKNDLWKEKMIQIPFKALRPCRNYTVRVTPDCKPSGNHMFATKELNKNDIKKTEVNESGFYLETKWNLSKYFDIMTNESCTLKSLNFDDNCASPIEIYIPPKIPMINFTNMIPTTLEWTNKPEQCTNVTININCSEGQENLLLNKMSVDTIKPFQNYSCSGTFDSNGTQIQTKNFSVFIKCVMEGNVSDVQKNHFSISAKWNLKSPNCPTSKFDAEVTCNSDKGSCTGVGAQMQCNVSNLHHNTPYSCTFMAKYHKAFIYNETHNVTTTCGEPVFSHKPKVHWISHNAFTVTVTVSKWIGPSHVFKAELLIREKIENEKIQNNTNLDFTHTFDNLYYSTNYTLKIYAISEHDACEIMHSSDVHTKYNDKAVLGFLGFLIIITSIALLFVLYKIYLLKRKNSSDEREMDDLLPASTLLPVDPIAADALVEAYKKKIADEGRLFMEEFQSIPRIFSNYTVKEAKKAENQSKNRYVDILPYDYNRVPLSNGGKHDYINASFIEGYKESNKYIAAQGPKEETIGDFWRMIWEQQTSIIVMVTRCEEGNKNKCAQYWPSVERDTELFDDFVVKIKGEENCPDYIIRRLSLMNKKEKTAERDVTHIQFTSWPDHGVPGEPGLLLKLRRRVNSFKNFFSGPIVIHCSAGVGRTGTYIGIDAMIESLEAEGRVDIYGYVVKLRRQRCLMVQVEAQYVLIHTALIEYNQFGETEISLSDFHSVVNTLRQKEGSEPSLLEMEFQKIPKFKNWRTSNTASTEENKKKNRSSVVPYDFNRVLIKLEEDNSNGSDAEDEEDYSSDEEDETPTKYINASYVDGYWCPRNVITAQGPLPDTVADFLQMLYQHRVKTVVMLSDCTENGQEFCSQYWNDEKKDFGEMVVEVKETETFPTYIRRSLEIQHTKRKESHTTQQYHFLKWAGNELPANPHDLIDMMKTIRQNGGYKNSMENRGTPIVVHCNDGSSRSGIACALWNILDSADTEKLVDVFQVTKSLRKERHGMITSLEQYQFLYAALEVAFPVQNGEVKKAAVSPDTVQVINEETALISATAEDQEEAASSQPVEQQADAGASGASGDIGANGITGISGDTGTGGDIGASGDTGAHGASESSEQPEKPPSESATNGPTVTVEV